LSARAETVGWTDCGHNAWRTGRVLDPFAGSGTTLVAAHNESRDAIGIDLDDRNVAMVEDRLGPLVAACDLTVLT
jgi:DNA modification methylase